MVQIRVHEGYSYAEILIPFKNNKVRKGMVFGKMFRENSCVNFYYDTNATTKEEGYVCANYKTKNK